MEQILFGIATAVLLWLGGWFYKKKFKRPYLDVFIKYKSHRRTQLGLSPNNTYEILPDGRLATHLQNARFSFLEVVTYHLTVINNSEVSAHYIKAYGKRNKILFDTITPIDIKPITLNDKLELEATINNNLEFAASDSSRDEDGPKVIKEMEFLLEYKNTGGKSFYTHIYIKEGVSKKKYRFFKPRGFIPY